MKIIQGFGKKMKDLREKSGLTQKQLAAQMGLSKSAISQYELQERIPSPISLIKISSIFHVSSDYLLGIDNKNRLDLSGLTDEETEIIERLVDSMRRKNEKIKKF